jgi:hypothetical protein
MATPDTRPNVSPEAMQQAEQLTMLTRAGHWSALTADAFPLLPPLFIEQSQQQAFDVRLSDIANQLNQLDQFSHLFSNDETTLEQINGDRNALRSEVKDIFETRYPDVEPKKREPKEIISSLNRDVNAAIQFFIAQGEVEALTPEVIPELSLLQEKTLIELKIQALFARLPRYNEWESVWKGNENDQMGYQTKPENAPLEEITKLLKKQTMDEITSLANQLKNLISS